MRALKIGKGNTVVMTPAEFAVFMKDKRVYHFMNYWIEEWTTPVDRYFPYKGFVMESKYRLRRYQHAGYSEKCLDTYLTGGGSMFNVPRWKVTRTEAGATIQFYVTKET